MLGISKDALRDAGVFEKSISKREYKNLTNAFWLNTFL
jgi:hypothetical protein